MVLGFIVGLILMGFFVLGTVMCVRTFGHKKDYRVENTVPGKIGIAVMVVSAALFAVLPMSIHTVDTGEVAVVKHLGAAKNVRTAGTHFDFWLTDVYQVYDAKVQNIDISTDTYSSDAQTMDVQMTIQYQIMSEKVRPDEREEWVQKRLASGMQVLITNPSLVETGLDLNSFTTLIFYSMGYKLFTLRQASRRSWRINQTAPPLKTPLRIK